MSVHSSAQASVPNYSACLFAYLGFTAISVSDRPDNRCTASSLISSILSSRSGLFAASTTFFVASGSAAHKSFNLCPLYSPMVKSILPSCRSICSAGVNGGGVPALVTLVVARLASMALMVPG